MIKEIVEQLLKSKTKISIKEFVLSYQFCFTPSSFWNSLIEIECDKLKNKGKIKFVELVSEMLHFHSRNFGVKEWEIYTTICNSASNLSIKDQLIILKKKYMTPTQTQSKIEKRDVFLTTKTGKIAKALTVIELQLFEGLNLQDFYLITKSNQGLPNPSNSLSKIARRFELLSNFICTKILSIHQIEKRAAFIDKILTIIDKL